ncbi:hypothetical protein [Pantoea agglomerans]|uniref:hypothetical protein n=1 Tax=Enterobacter agglomerans TaxID=549 RepID=UPI000B91E41A|nr:hypothetical protein [Pantoea agglomerans]OXH79193.1 hypothetical protein CBI57_06640 [Pantoea agglomerans]WNK52245.1 hypothetical protein RM154_12755 [Pantoea agglomerans]
MHRIDTSTAQVDKFGAGKNGFTGGNPQTGELPTALDADFFDSVQEEISGVIETAGIPLDRNKNDQLLAAVLALFAPKLGSSNQVFRVSSAPDDNNAAVPVSLLSSGLRQKASLNGDAAQAFKMANNGTGSYGVNNDRLNFVLQSYAALAGNQFTQFSVGGATSAAHAVRLDQFQSGTNGNGAWTKMPGGGQWCRQNLTLAANTTTTWTFPAGFSAAPAVFVTAINGAFQCWLNGIGANNCGIFNNGTALNVNLLAMW